MRFRRVVLLVTVTVALGVPGVAHASGVAVADLAHGATAGGLASAMTGGGVTVSNVTFTGDSRSAGTFTTGASSVGFAAGIVLSSGKVQTYGGGTPDPACSRGVEGPNNCNEDPATVDGGENTADFDTAGDSQLDTLSGKVTEDAAVLAFDFVPQQATVHFRYVFSSEEYSDYANSDFNDVFAFFVNGTNCALVPGTSDPVAVNTINNGNPDGDATAQMPHHAELFRDNVNPTPGTIDSQMDGLTTILTCNASVNAGVTNHMKLAIADASDGAFDSAVFLESGSLTSGETLTVNKSGTGAGGVTSSPAGIDCGATCTHQFAENTPVTLTATADAGSTFTGWSGGGCTGTGTCSVTMDQARTVTATFTLNPTHLLTVNKDGTGTGGVTSSPAGIDCGATCSHSYAQGQMITLTATPTFGSTFAGWSGGGCSGTGSCVVTMGTSDVVVTATFTLLPTHTLTVTKSGNGSGGVTSSPAGIDCGATCSHAFPEGAQITLTATPASDSDFAGWSGGGCSGTGTCIVTMGTGNVTVTATFTLKNYALTVAKNGTGSGGVTSAPAGINCGATCSASYDHGTVVTLTATAAAGSTFTGWSGEGCSGIGTCTVTMSQARSVTATFTQDTQPPPGHTLTVTKAGTGTGGVTSSPAGIDCGSTCSASYTSATSVTLTATATGGSTFTGWSGDCTGTGTCTVTMSADHSVTATFTAPIVSPPSVGSGDLFCGAQHRGKCKGITTKVPFTGPGNASWTYDVYNPSPGKGATAAASKKIRLGQIKKVIKKAGTVTVVFKLRPGAKTNRLYTRVKKLKLRNLLITVRFTDTAGNTTVQTKTVKLKQ
jgi:List-Bact-rpt repeat protein